MSGVPPGIACGAHPGKIEERPKDAKRFVVAADEVCFASKLTNKVRYTVEDATDLEVARVNVFIDALN